MSRQEVDLLLLRDGEPIAVVEAKGIPIATEFRRAVLEQLRMYARETGSRWALLVDPVSTLVYRSERIGEPVAEIPTREVLQSAALDQTIPLGGRLLLLAVERWLSATPASPQPDGRPELADFFRDISRSNQLVRDARIG